MTRSGFRRLWLLVLVILMGASYIVYNKTTDKQFQIESQILTKENLLRERKASKALAEKLKQVDELTLHESDATLLDILRFISLEEERSFTFTAGTKLLQQAGDVQVYERSFMLKATLPYAYMQRRLDELYENERITLQSVKLEHVDKPGGLVKAEISAKMFALNKQGQEASNVIRRKR
ncbi:MAG: hypothetical protein OSB62_07935 [Alphaproteobacteria bacterium]|nr:hypothetical protein [Alphaproteobacteria bacterium]